MPVETNAITDAETHLRKVAEVRAIAEGHRDDVIKAIRDALRKRSGKPWSVSGGRGTSWGWITITAPPARRDEYGSITGADREELGALLGITVHHQGESVPTSDAYRRVALARALFGDDLGFTAEPYWD